MVEFYAIQGWETNYKTEETIFIQTLSCDARKLITIKNESTV